MAAGGSVMTCDGIRGSILGILELFASTEAQREYQRAVPFVSVPVELFCVWANDLYHPDAQWFPQAFSGPEQEALAAFHQIFERVAATLPNALPNLDTFSTTSQARELAAAATVALTRLERGEETNG